MQEVVFAKPGRKACKDAALGTTSLVDGIRRGDDGGVVDLSTHICFLGVFAWGIKGKIEVTRSFQEGASGSEVHISWRQCCATSDGV